MKFKDTINSTIIAIISIAAILLIAIAIVSAMPQKPDPPQHCSCHQADNSDFLVGYTLGNSMPP